MARRARSTPEQRDYIESLMRSTRLTWTQVGDVTLYDDAWAAIDHLLGVRDRQRHAKTIETNTRIAIQAKLREEAKKPDGLRKEGAYAAAGIESTAGDNCTEFQAQNVLLYLNNKPLRPTPDTAPEGETPKLATMADACAGLLGIVADERAGVRRMGRPSNPFVPAIYSPRPAPAAKTVDLIKPTAPIKPTGTPRSAPPPRRIGNPIFGSSPAAIASPPVQPRRGRPPALRLEGAVETPSEPVVPYAMLIPGIDIDPVTGKTMTFAVPVKTYSLKETWDAGRQATRVSYRGAPEPPPLRVRTIRQGPPPSPPPPTGACVIPSWLE